ncbi:MAG: tetratricopeptide repeat protein [Myxococcaceae bacterium]|nr:tetratricopeptide repeat protein [Myxococcaceae bacterium]MBH2005858.1 tetratricopeptide repeat protein [Myxococcaceae bacterium]
MRLDIDRLRRELVNTQREDGDRILLLENRVKKLESGVFKSSADQSLEREKLVSEVEQLKTQLEEIQSKPLVEKAPELNTDASKHLSKSDQLALIQQAYLDKRYEKAILESDVFLSRFSGDKPLAAQVLFWRGDAYFELGEYKKAILSFQEFLTKYPSFNKASEVLYKVGLSLEALKYPKDAKVFFEEILSKHPKSSFAAKASQRLKKK